jgi:hypothetical protein
MTMSVRAHPVSVQNLWQPSPVLDDVLGRRAAPSLPEVSANRWPRDSVVEKSPTTDLDELAAERLVL